MDKFKYEWEFAVNNVEVDCQILESIACMIATVVGDPAAIYGWEMSENGDYQVVRVRGDVNRVVEAAEKIYMAYPGALLWMKMDIK